MFFGLLALAVIGYAVGVQPPPALPVVQRPAIIARVSAPGVVSPYAPRPVVRSRTPGVVSPYTPRPVVRSRERAYGVVAPWAPRPVVKP